MNHIVCWLITRCVFYSPSRVCPQVLRWNSRLRLHSHLRDPHKDLFPSRRHGGDYEQVRTGQHLHAGVRSKPRQNPKRLYRTGEETENQDHVQMQSSRAVKITARIKGCRVTLAWVEQGPGALDSISALGWWGVPKLTIKQNSHGVGCFIKPVVPPKPLLRVDTIFKETVYPQFLPLCIHS